MQNIVMAIKVDNRSAAAKDVQQILTQYGEYIRLRVGIHGDEAENGRILLQVVAPEDQLGAMTAALNGLDLVKVQTMTLD